MRTKLAIAFVAIAIGSYGAMATDAPVTTPDVLSAFSRTDAPLAFIPVPEGRLVAVGDIVLEGNVVTLHGMGAPMVSGTVAAALASGTPMETFLAKRPRDHR